MTYADLMRLANGYAESKTLLIAAELGLFTALGNKARSVSELARACRTTGEGMRLLLNALVGLKLLSLRNGVYRNQPLARTFLHERSPEAVTNLLWLLTHHWSDWTEMSRVIRRGRAGWAPVTTTATFRRRFALAMHERSHALAPATVAAIPLPRGKIRLLDLAGGPGSYSIALARRYSKLTGLLVDQSVSVARSLIKQHRLQQRLALRAGDVFTAKLGDDYDAALVANLIHDFDERDNRRLLGRVYRALKPGGKLFIVEFFLDDSATKPVDAAVFSLLMYKFTPGGRSYGWREVEGWLSEKGFGRFRR
jgi:2-polyprenyl-3-methyl-5-hydroxy-6-metoxy-1,4-benzoquinol methylase